MASNIITETLAPIVKTVVTKVIENGNGPPAGALSKITYRGGVYTESGSGKVSYRGGVLTE